MGLNVTLLEPYYGGSHQRWADGYQQHTQHHITLLTLPAQAWKWRMQGGAVSLARLFNESGAQPDVILASDMMNLATFRTLTRARTHSIPHALYFHENQLTYPQNSRQGHGWRYGFINYVSALSADRVLFNSQYHLDAFFEALPKMLKHFYDFNELDTVAELRQRSAVLPLGMNLRRFDAFHVVKSPGAPPLILWNHRWEEDKNPAAFLRLLRQLAERNVAFQVALLGERVRHFTPEFERTRDQLGERVVQFGYADDFAAYARWLWQADYVVSTAHQEFFGGAIAEAIYCGCIPLLPKRLNYPYLIPVSAYDACLYRAEADLLPLMLSHLSSEVMVDSSALRDHITAYDWGLIAPRYDDTLTRLAQDARLAG